MFSFEMQISRKEAGIPSFVRELTGRSTIILRIDVFQSVDCSLKNKLWHQFVKEQCEMEKE